jgi:hypothetical protein
MTMALCFHCGATKFGAICPCGECGVPSTGNVTLDILFSDHRLSVQTLKAFGELVRSIRRACDDDELCFWSFIYHVAVNHPELLDVKLEPELESRCIDVLERANPPRVIVEESERSRMMREIEQRTGSA